MELSDRAKSIPPSITLAIGAKVKELKAAGEKVIAFGAGEPDFATPDTICSAAIQQRLCAGHFLFSLDCPAGVTGSTCRFERPANTKPKTVCSDARCSARAPLIYYSEK